MADFLLLHGGQHGGWCWDGERSILTAAGHRVEAPDLPGGGGRPATLGEVAEAAAGPLGRLSDGVVVVAHSMGGMAAVLLADRYRTRLGGVLFAAAVVPAPGVAVLRDAFGRTGSLLMGALGRPEPIRPVAAYFFGHRLGRTERRNLLGRLRAEDLSRARVPFPAYDLSGVRCHYLLTTRDRLLRPRTQRRFAARLPGGEVSTVDGGHSVPIEHPAVVARTAQGLARAAVA
ncbi:MAG TPA: alpha/beta hydrolase [Acidimicrobiia bacterium]|nr:alpha/beta hydrolase [Acidimicrobiia bacterium]